MKLTYCYKSVLPQLEKYIKKKEQLPQEKNCLQDISRYCPGGKITSIQEPQVWVCAELNQLMEADLGLLCVV